MAWWHASPVSPTPGIHPRDVWRPTGSKAEQEVWTALARGMPAGWYGWHSLRVRDRGGYEGEGDFVLAHPQRGLLLLEVKGGQVEQRDGRWFQNGRPMEKAPLDQARGFVRKLLARLRNLGAAPPAFGCAVWFPGTVLPGQPSQDDVAGVVLGREELAYAREALPAIVERAIPAAGAARGRWIDALHRLWGESWIPGLSLGVRVREAAESRIALDAQQLQILDGLLGNPRVLVQGGAGSGKTLLAAEAARRLAADGKKVLLLCFTAPLGKWLAQRAGGDGVEVDTISGFARTRLVQATGCATSPHLTDVEWRGIFLQAEEICSPEWDAVVVDEAQDLHDEAWLLVEKLARGRTLWAFHDPGQGYWPERHPPAELFGASFKLQRQQRCPPGVQALADRIAGLPSDAEAIARAREDGTIGLVTAPSATSVPDKIGEEVDRLLSAGLSPGEVGIVSLRGQTAREAVFNLPRVGRHEVVRADHDEMETKVVADSFLRWKGLERPAIIVADLPEGELRQLPVRLHVALTRAVAAVRLVGVEEGLRRLPGLSADRAQ